MDHILYVCMDQESVTKLRKNKKIQQLHPSIFRFNINNLKSTNLSRVGALGIPSAMHSWHLQP